MNYYDFYIRYEITHLVEMRNAYTILDRKSEMRRSLRRVGLDGRITLKCIRKVRWQCVNLIHLPQDRDLWLALLNTVREFRVP
jgi:hypothetical protein